MIGGDEEIPRRSLYALMLRVQSQVDVVESRLTGLEKRMAEQIKGISEHLEEYERRATYIIYAVLTILVIGGITMLVLYLWLAGMMVPIRG